VAAMAAFYFVYWMSGYRGQWLDLPSSGKLYATATTMTFAAVVATQIGNLFAQRTERTSIFRVGIFGNRLVWWGIATELGLLAFIAYVPAVQPIFGTAAIPWTYWPFLVAWVPALVVADEIRKAAVRWRAAR
jgi:magnesium-transporting ATPase (P-type)